MPEDQRMNQSPPQRAYMPIPPLYGAQPPKAQMQSQSNRPAVGNDVLARHQDSHAKYPQLNLSPGEYVIEAMRRNPIGILSIWCMTGTLSLIAIALIPLYALNAASFVGLIGINANVLPPASVLVVPVLILIALFILGGFTATTVYDGNRFFLTNESVIQFLRPSLFTTKTQIVNLINIEDASYEQRGLLQQILNYGTLRLSTKGEETTYHFFFVTNPGRMVNAVNDAMEDALRTRGGAE